MVLVGEIRDEERRRASPCRPRSLVTRCSSFPLHAIDSGRRHPPLHRHRASSRSLVASGINGIVAQRPAASSVQQLPPAGPPLPSTRHRLVAEFTDGQMPDAFWFRRVGATCATRPASGAVSASTSCSSSPTRCEKRSSPGPHTPSCATSPSQRDEDHAGAGLPPGHRRGHHGRRGAAVGVRPGGGEGAGPEELGPRSACCARVLGVARGNGECPTATACPPTGGMNHSRNPRPARPPRTSLPGVGTPAAVTSHTRRSAVTNHAATAGAAGRRSLPGQVKGAPKAASLKQKRVQVRGRDARQVVVKGRSSRRRPTPPATSWRSRACGSRSSPSARASTSRSPPRRSPAVVRCTSRQGHLPGLASR